MAHVVLEGLLAAMEAEAVPALHARLSLVASLVPLCTSASFSEVELFLRPPRVPGEDYEESDPLVPLVMAEASTVEI